MAVLDSFSLQGKVSVVTGAARGIGRALALALAEAGSDVAVVVRDPAAVQDLLTELTALGVRAVAVAADVTDAAKRNTAVVALQRTMLQQSPWVWLFSDNNVVAMGSGVTGLGITADNSLRSLATATRG